MINGSGNGIGIAVSGLLAQGTKLGKAAENIANSESKNYTAKEVELQSTASQGRPGGVRALVQDTNLAVNLDEQIFTTLEASQSYKAGATTIRIQQDTFDALLNAVGSSVNEEA